MKGLKIFWITVVFLNFFLISGHEKDSHRYTYQNVGHETGSDSRSVEEIQEFEKKVTEVYHSLSGISSLPSYHLFRLGFQGLNKLHKQGFIPRSEIITLIDLSLPSTMKRMWVIDVNSGKVLSHNLVAHGRNSGLDMACTFSNNPGSFQTSLGFYCTSSLYEGSNGLSLILDGLEKGFNDKARERAIVMHGADYATPEFIAANGRLGRSFGCPSIPPDLKKKILPLIAEGSCLFIYSPDKNYLSGSKIINSQNSLLASSGSNSF